MSSNPTGGNFWRFFFLCNLDLSDNLTEMHIVKNSNQVFHDRPVWCISVRLSDRSEVTLHKINFVKKCPQWGLNSQPLDHQSNALPDELSHYLVVCVIIKAFIKSCSNDSRNKQSQTCELMHKTKESSLQKSPTDSWLAQLSEHQTNDPEVVSSNPTRGNF